MEAKKSHDLQSANWRPRRPNGLSFSLKTSRLQTQEEFIFWFKSKGHKRSMSGYISIQEDSPLL